MNRMNTTIGLENKLPNINFKILQSYFDIIIYNRAYVKFKLYK